MEEVEFINSAKRSEDRTAPCGTPEEAEETVTHWILFTRYE